MKKRSKSRFQQYFLDPCHPLQRRYEALRAYYCNNLSQEQVAKQYMYNLSSLKSLISKFETGQIKFLLPEKKRGPKQPHTKEPIIQQIISLRKKNVPTEEIYEKINQSISIRSIQRILNRQGFARLPRRTKRARGLTKQGSIIPLKSCKLDWSKIEPQRFRCKVAGIYLFIPYLLKLEFPNMIDQSNFPGTSVIPKLHSALSILALKLIGKDRLSHINDFGFDDSIGLFADLNFLPKITWITTYTYGIDKQMTVDFMKSFVKKINSLSEDRYPSNVINLDFHAIPHWGEKEKNELENNWVPTRKKAMSSALSLFAQDQDSRILTYCNADIRKVDASKEILKFVDFWIDVKGIFKGTLVFDCKLTSYEHLNDLDKQAPKIKFITLRSRRGKSMIKDVLSISDDEWTTINLKIEKRKFNKIKVYEKDIELEDYEGKIRQIIIKDHGREKPTFMITNNWDLDIKDCAIIYAKKWRIENKISELIKFFSLNALNSPIMIRIFFDVLFTLIADSLYRLLANDLSGHEFKTPSRLFREFIDCSGYIDLTADNKINVTLRRKAHTPLLKSLPIFKQPHVVPWMNNRQLIFQWKN